MVEPGRCHGREPILCPEADLLRPDIRADAGQGSRMGIKVAREDVDSIDGRRQPLVYLRPQRSIEVVDETQETGCLEGVGGEPLGVSKARRFDSRSTPGHRRALAYRNSMACLKRLRCCSH